MSLFSPGIPSGVICMWAGTVATIPVGWYLCDGTNGTPNLSDRFIVGETTTPGGTGGTISPSAALTTHVFTQPSAHVLGTSGAGSAHSHTGSGSTGNESAANHAHTLSSAGWSYVTVAASGASSNVRVQRVTVPTWTPTVGESFSGTGSATSTDTVAAPLGGSTDSGPNHSHTMGSVASESTHTHTAGSISNNHSGGAVDAHAVYKYYKMAFIQKA